MLLSSATSGEFSTTIKSNKHFSIYAQPTYALSESTSLFLKAAYHQTRVSIKDDLNYSINSYTKTLHGFGIGTGAIFLLSKNIFTKLEIEFVDYSKVNIYDRITSSSVIYKLSTTSGTLSIGYKF